MNKHSGHTGFSHVKKASKEVGCGVGDDAGAGDGGGEAEHE